MIENLKELVRQMDNKSDFAKVVSDYFKIKQTSVINHWLGSGWDIPEQYKPKVVDLAQRMLSEQIKDKQVVIIKTKEMKRFEYLRQVVISKNKDDYTKKEVQKAQQFIDKYLEWKS